MSRFARRLGVGSLAALVTFSLAACGGTGGQGSGAAADGELEKTAVTVGSLPLADYATLYWAQDKGFFEDEGLTVTLEPLQGGSIGAQKVASGELDFSFTNTISTAIATESGMPIKTVVLASALADGGLLLYVQPDSPVQTLADVDGKTVGINTTQNIGDVTLKNLARSQGLDIEPRFVEVPFPEMLTGVQSGSIDVGYSPEPFASAARDAGMRQVADLTEGPNAGLAVSNFVASSTFVEENPDTTAAFARAMYAANEDLLQNEEEFRTWLPTVAKLDPRVAANMPVPQWITETDVDEIQRVADVLVDQDLLPEGYDAAEHTWLSEDAS